MFSFTYLIISMLYAHNGMLQLSTLFFLCFIELCCFTMKTQRLIKMTQQVFRLFHISFFLLEKWKKQFVCVFSRDLEIHRLNALPTNILCRRNVCAHKIVRSKSIRVVQFIVKLFFVLPLYLCKSIFHSISNADFNCYVYTFLPLTMYSATSINLAKFYKTTYFTIAF